jgi:hypothetical protein
MLRFGWCWGLGTSLRRQLKRMLRVHRARRHESGSAGHLIAIYIIHRSSCFRPRPGCGRLASSSRFIDIFEIPFLAWARARLRPPNEARSRSATAAGDSAALGVRDGASSARRESGRATNKPTGKPARRRVEASAGA